MKTLFDSVLPSFTIRITRVEKSVQSKNTSMYLVICLKPFYYLFERVDGSRAEKPFLQQNLLWPNKPARSWILCEVVALFSGNYYQNIHHNRPRHSCVLSCQAFHLG